MLTHASGQSYSYCVALDADLETSNTIFCKVRAEEEDNGQSPRPGQSGLIETINSRVDRACSPRTWYQYKHSGFTAGSTLPERCSW